MAAATYELTRLRYMFEDLHIQLKLVTLFCTNQAAPIIAEIMCIMNALSTLNLTVTS